MIPRSKLETSLLRDRNKPLARQWLCFYQDANMNKCPCGRKCSVGREIFNPITFERLVIGKCCAQALKLKTIDSNAVLFDVTNAPERRTPWCLFKAMIEHKNLIKEQDIKTLGELMFKTPTDDMANLQRAKIHLDILASVFCRSQLSVCCNNQYPTLNKIAQPNALFKCCNCLATTEKAIPTDLTIGFQRLDLLRQKVRDPRMKLPKPLNEQVRDEFNANVREQHMKSQQ